MFTALVSNSADYCRVHRQVKREKGQANTKRCIKCRRQAHDWAWLHHLDPLLSTSYRPMCRRCHIRYDREEQPIESGINIPTSFFEKT